METVIFCGGKGTRLAPLTDVLPKPMIYIGRMPILEHIIRYYAHFGHNDFILCLGHKGDIIRSYFEGKSQWNIRFVETGEDANKAQRLKTVEKHIKGDTFLLSYGDDLSDIDLNALLALHKSRNGVLTLTTTMLRSPFGTVDFDGTGKVVRFREKPLIDTWINAGYYVVDRQIFEYINESDDFEKDIIERLSPKGLVYAYRHSGFWMGMTTHQDTMLLNEMWKNGNAPWVVWEK